MNLNNKYKRNVKEPPHAGKSGFDAGGTETQTGMKQLVAEPESLLARGGPFH